jgi:Raf kinase inhibitor-like YbhB/YbcL family protein
MSVAMKQRFRLYLSCVVLGSGLMAAACSDDDDPSTGLGGSGGSSTGGAAGSSGSGGSAGSGGAAGSSAGSGGSSAGNAGSGGAAGAAGSGAGAAGSAGETPDAGDDGGALAFSVSSPAFDNQPGCGADDRDACDLFPDANTGLGEAENVSPAIDWTGAPPGTQSFAIALHDLTFIQGNGPFTHWVMWNIPSSATGLPAELPQGVMPGVPAADTQQYSFRDTRGYTGSGACGNVYEFVLYALSTATFTPPDPNNQNSVQDALDASDDVIATATMRARSDPDGPSCN